VSRRREENNGGNHDGGSEHRPGLQSIMDSHARNLATVLNPDKSSRDYFSEVAVFRLAPAA
jgi:hypothetical protein